MDLIIGSGISGLSFVNFYKHSDYAIIEKDDQIGGYCKTVKKDGFTWDHSGHFFHFRYPEIEKYLLERLKGQEILRINKKTQIKYKDLYIDFPFQKNIHQLSKDEFIDCLFDLFDTKIKKFSTFKEMIYSKFGKSISEIFLIPYNEKVYATDLNELDYEAMGRFFPHANKEEIIKNFRKPDNSSYNTYFTYPRNGAVQYINALYSEVDPIKVKLNEELLAVDLKHKIATTNLRDIKYDKLISTIPFPKLLDVCNIEYDKSIYSWNKVLVFNMGFDKKGKDTLNHWIYFPEKKYVFYRIGYYDNILSEDRLSLYIEIGLEKDQQVDINILKDKVIKDLNIAGIIHDQNLLAYNSVIMDPAYVHINMSSNNDKKIKKEYLKKHDIFTIGRYGDWKYCSIEDNILDAKNLTEQLNLLRK